MKKPLFLSIFIIFILILFSLPCSAAGQLVAGGGFEDSDGNKSAQWTEDAWKQGPDNVRFTLSKEKAHSGKFSAKIENIQPNDSKWVQRVNVQPNKLYRLSGWVLAQQAGEAAKGANLSVLDILETSRDLKNTDGRWEKVELYGKTGPGQKELKIAARLGGYGSLNTGTAYFDDIALEEVSQAPEGSAVISFAGKQQPGADVNQTHNGISGAVFPILFYALVFFALYGAVYRVLIRKDRLEHASAGAVRAITAVVLAGGLAARLLIAPVTPGYSSDMATFTAWAGTAASAGLSRFYAVSTFTDYPPGYVYVLYALGKLRSVFHLPLGSPGLLLLMKSPAMLADLVTGYVLLRLVKPMAGIGAAVALALLYVFNPAVLVDSAVWGQVDSFFTLFLLLSLLQLAKGRLERATILFALTLLIKPQALIFAPVYLFAFLRGRSWKRFAQSSLAGIGAFVLLVIPFSVHQHPLWIAKLYGKTLASYPYATLNAFNLFALAGGNWQPQGATLFLFSYQVWGTTFLVLSVGFAGYLFWRKKGDRPGNDLLLALLLVTCVVLLGAKMHERYWFPAIALSAASFAYFKDRRLLQVFLGISVCQFINIAYVYAFSKVKIYQLPKTDGLLLLTSAVSLLLLAYLVKISYDLLIAGRSLPVPDAKADPVAVAKLLSNTDGNNGGFHKRDWLLMGGLTLVYAAVAIWNLGSAQDPRTLWQPAVSGESFYVDLGSVKSIERINSFGEIGEGKFKLEFAKDAPADWRDPQTVDLNYTKVFAWNVLKVGEQARFVKFTVESSGFTLNELAFYEKDGKQPIPVSAVHGEGMTAPVRGAVDRLFDEPGKSVYHPTYKDGTYFDEIYHARTAYEHLHNMKPYENTHPPLGKLLISVGIMLFGMNPFGWRIVGTVVGIAMVPLMYVFGKRMFGKTHYAFMTSFLLAFDFMHFAQTRIATIDVYGVFFIILMYYFMYRYVSQSFYRVPLKRTLVPLFWSGLFFGIGAASKWIVVYGGGGLALLFFASLYERYREYEAAKQIQSGAQGKALGEDPAIAAAVRSFWPNTFKTLLWSVPFFLLIPGVIYSISFLPYMTVPGEHISLQHLIQYQKDMWDYHSKLTATHAFASPWWEWPFMHKPIWFYSGQSLLPQGKVSSIVSMGNPAVWWPGAVAAVAAAVLAWRRRDKGMAVVLAGFIFQYVPWMLVTRVTFIYHFFAMVPFLVICLVYVFKVLNEEYGLRIWFNFAYMGVVLLLFVMFYPILSGLVVDKWYVQTFLRWLPTWYFYS